MDLVPVKIVVISSLILQICNQNNQYMFMAYHVNYMNIEPNPSL